MGEYTDPTPATSNGTLALSGVVSETALDLQAGLSFDEWAEVGHTLGRIGRAHQWWVGDWLNYGERAYGEKYSQAMDATGLDYSTVANAAWVSKSVEVSRRRENLSFSHHREVAKFEPAEQDEWLDRAEAEDWSRSELREQLQGTDEPIRVRCPTCDSVVKPDRLHGRV